MPKSKTKAAPPKKRRYHDTRGDGGKFAPRPQDIKPPPKLQQAWLAGATPGWWISDHMEELRHFVSWIYVGVHKIAQQWAQATVNVYDDNEEEADEDLLKHYSPRVKALAKMCKRWRQKSDAPDAPNKDKLPLKDHEILTLLKEPNEFMSGRQFMYQMACQLRLTGGAYIWEVPNQYGEPEDLWVIPRGWARPMAPNGNNPLGWYQITPIFNTFTQGLVSPTSSTYTIPFEQMITLGWPSPPYPGEFTSPLSACSREIDIMEQVDTAVWSGMQNSVKPSMVFSIDPKSGVLPTKEMMDQFMSELETFKAGSSNAGKVLAMLGLTVQQMMSGPSELDYVAGRDQTRKNTLGIQGVTEVVAGLGGTSSYSEAAVGAKATIEFSVAPDLDMTADKLTVRWQKYWPGKRIGFDPKNFDDPTIDLQKTDKIQAGFTAGYVSANEARASIDLPPLDDPIADIPQVLLQPMMPQVGSPDAGMPGMDDGEDPYAAFESSMVDMDDDMAGADGPGQKNPLMQEASGNRASKMYGAFRLNGHLNGSAK